MVRSHRINSSLTVSLTHLQPPVKLDISNNHYKLGPHGPLSNSRWPQLQQLLSPQFHGTLTLLIDPKLLTQPFGQRVMIAGFRAVLRIHSAPIYASPLKFLGVGPDDSNERRWEFVKNKVVSSWHMSGTARMGKGGGDSC
ncbi:hypothetical protein CC80DRAFT_240721 [Byssothecium circinans]|uniref:Glucose-methanol-choline oxidoreductase C-terminal domain-containing protein n=1 Tax=Byssothecium circinans TaxID=147558 RepID=A0A6A5TC77_9PLEO|nr:hypothetical protein CC80DRAFT_240721 [Byssothecium circinans]